MFTGIVTAIGTITAITPQSTSSAAEAGLHLTIAANNLSLTDVALGDSIAINGACMTVVDKTDTHFSIDISRESLNRTAGLDTPGEVNLEKAVTLADRLGGHLVTGHIDDIGHVKKSEPIAESWQLVVLTPLHLAKYLAYKGSIVINGVSLTINQVTDVPNGCEISVNLIPHTVRATTLKHLQAGDPVNLEVDLIARYCERMLGYQNAV